MVYLYTKTVGKLLHDDRCRSYLVNVDDDNNYGQTTSDFSSSLSAAMYFQFHFRLLFLFTFLVVL